MTKTQFIAAAFAAAATLAAGVAFAQADVIKARKDGFQANKTAMGAIKGVIDANGPAAGVVKPAQDIAAWSKGLAAHFPAGSDKPAGSEKDETKALPNIWTDMANFKKAASDTEAKATLLAAAGQSGDLNAVKAAFGELGKSCSACHDTYRAK